MVMSDGRKVMGMKLFAAGMTLLMTVPLLFAGRAAAQFDPLGQACQGQSDAAVCQESADAQDSENPVSGSDGVITRAANIIALATGAVAVLIILVAGITTTLSAGDASRVKASRDAIIYAAVGLVVIALARTIVVFIVNRV